MKGVVVSNGSVLETLSLCIASGPIGENLKTDFVDLTDFRQLGVLLNGTRDPYGGCARACASRAVSGGRVVCREQRVMRNYCWGSCARRDSMYCDFGVVATKDLCASVLSRVLWQSGNGPFRLRI